MISLDRKVALITGAGAGIGRAAALLFARAGASVGVAERDEATGAETVRQIEAEGGRALLLHTDVTLPESAERAIDRSVQAFGKLDVLYNNAGGSTSADGPVTQAPFDEFWRVIKLDLFGTWLCCRFAVPRMIEAGGGSIINTTSMLALVGTPGKDAYTAAKGGVAALTRSMAVEFAPQRIRVNAIAPGLTLSERVLRLQKRGRLPQEMLDAHLLGLVEPLDIAYAALYLASDTARMTTGQILPVDSGRTIS